MAAPILVNAPRAEVLRMEMLETVAVPAVSEDWKCPFEHKEGVKHDKKNVIPKHKGTNDATKLANAIDKEQGLSAEARLNHVNSVDVHMSAHHILPGNEAWNKDKALKKWIDDSADGSKVFGDIGYDVNDHNNGVYLGSGTLFAKYTSKISKREYTVLVMEGTGQQYHDRHEPYSDFVVNCFIKIAEALEERTKIDCDQEHCGGQEDKGGKMAPPYMILPRLHALANRLKALLTGPESTWRMPVVTSKYVVMHVDDVDADTAKESLKKAQEKLKAARPK